MFSNAFAMNYLCPILSLQYWYLLGMLQYQMQQNKY